MMGLFLLVYRIVDKFKEYSFREKGVPISPDYQKDSLDYKDKRRFLSRSSNLGNIMATGHLLVKRHR